MKISAICKQTKHSNEFPSHSTVNLKQKENDLSEKPSGEEAGGGGGGEENVCWVSRTLQHLISVDSDKETLTMINQHPANLNIFNSYFAVGMAKLNSRFRQDWTLIIRTFD